MESILRLFSAGYGVIAAAMGSIFSTGALVALFRYLGNGKESPIVLAQVSMALAGFVLVSFFVERANEDLKRRLGWTARFAMLAAVGFIGVSLWLPAIDGAPDSIFWQGMSIIIILMYAVAAFLFGLAVYSLLALLPKLGETDAAKTGSG